MEKDNAIILILLILIAIASCVCIIVTGANISLVQPHETNTSDLPNMTANKTNLNTTHVSVDSTQRDTGIYAPDSSESSGGNYYSGQSYQYSSSSYDYSQSSQSTDSGQSSESADSGQSSQGTDSGSSSTTPDAGQNEQTGDQSDFE